MAAYTPEVLSDRESQVLLAKLESGIQQAHLIEDWANFEDGIGAGADWSALAVQISAAWWWVEGGDR